MVNKYKVYISPSNHGVGNNRCRKSGCYEDKHTRPIAEVTAKYLRATGQFDVYVADANKGVVDRCREADRLGCSLYICIHSNASSSKEARYLMFMAMTAKGEHIKMLKTISAPVHAVYPKGALQLVARPDLIEVNTPQAMTCYCEMGFHTNDKDCNEFIHKPEMVGKELARGVCNYYKVKFNATNTSGTSNSNTKPSSTSKPASKVSAKTTFIKGVQSACGATVDGVAGNETLSKTITVSATKNRKHKVVKHIQVYLNHLGYNCGEADGVAGDKFTVAVKKYQKANGCVADGEITAKEKTWQKLLGLA